MTPRLPLRYEVPERDVQWLDSGSILDQIAATQRIRHDAVRHARKVGGDFVEAFSGDRYICAAAVGPDQAPSSGRLRGGLREVFAALDWMDATGAWRARTCVRDLAVVGLSIALLTWLQWLQ